MKILRKKWISRQGATTHKLGGLSVKGQFWKTFLFVCFGAIFQFDTHKFLSNNLQCRTLVPRWTCFGCCHLGQNQLDTVPVVSHSICKLFLLLPLSEWTRACVSSLLLQRLRPLFLFALSLVDLNNLEK